MVHYLKAVKAKRTVIDELILSEQTVNIFAGLYIILLLLRLTVPSSSQFADLLLRNAVTCVLTEVIVVFAFFHRAVAGCGIAGIRKVPETHLFRPLSNQF